VYDREREGEKEKGRQRGGEKERLRNREGDSVYV
jgi:hypothetical protein